ncbi:MAG: ribonucleoside-diphosphate reductase, adenosylcobalamin-dependent, partial [Candidatus Levybacteria bacterium]|nr:ribonucleoside-diphosphate reductase, adenosylcobalamin-dependent [Candidatus Levybacteria bacterium]
FEVFITIGKSGSDVAAMAEALGRMISLNLRLSGGIEPRERIRQVVAQLAGIGGARSVGFGKERVRSLPDAVAKILAKHFSFKVNGVVEDSKKIQTAAVINGEAHANGEIKKNGEVKEEDQKDMVMLQQLSLEGGAASVIETFPSGGTNLFDICPECGVGGLAYEEGCRKCYSCGYAEC